jgi:hypothetical protein
MKRISAIVAIVVAALSITSAAFAGAGGNPPSTNGGSKGNGTQTVKYTAVYTDYFFGPVSCSGVHQTGKNFGSNGQDSFTCTSTSGLPLTNTYPGELLSASTFGGWLSDFNGLGATSFAGTVSADGFSQSAVALYG